MNTVLYFTASGTAYETRAYTKADIDRLVQEQGLYCLTSEDSQFDFWFSPTAAACQRRINRPATELLLATTRLNAKSVPLLRGAVVIASHDSDGDLDGLSWQQMDHLAQRSLSLSRRDDRILGRRIAADERARRSRRTAAAPAPISCARPRASAPR